MNTSGVAGLAARIKGRRLSGHSWLILLLGVVLIAGLWLFVRQQINQDYDRTISETSQETMNLSVAFEEHVRRIADDADKDLLSLKQAYEQDGLSSPVITAYVKNTAKDPARNQVAICDEQGNIIVSFVERAFLTNIADREYFQFQRNSNADALFIGQTITVRAVPQITIPLTRRIDKPDGSFAGIVYIGLKADYFLSFYEKIDLGPNQLISLIGMDGVTLARQNNNNLETGQDVRGSAIWQGVQTGRTYGTYMASSMVDGISRIVSYRAMADYPLIVSVSKSTQAALAGFEQRKKSSILGAILTSLFILVCCGLLINRSEVREDLTAAVREEKERLTALISSISDEVWFADSGKKFALANPAALKEFGLGGPEIDVEKLASSLEVLRPDGSPRPVEEAPPLRALQGEAVRNQEEIVRVPASGELRYREVSANPVRDAAGNIIGAVSIARDVTERKQLEEELRRSEAILRVVTEYSPDPIFLKDRHSRLLLANPATVRAFGKPLAEILGKNDAQIYDDPSIGQSILEADRRIMDSGCTEAVEEKIETPEGRRIFLSSKTPWRDAAGEIIGLIGVAHDITERKAMEDELVRNRNQLQEINASLEEEIAERQAAQAALTTSHEELQDLNATLETEIAERQAAQESLHEAHDDLMVSETRYHGLFEHMRKAFVYMEMVMDEGGRPVDHEILDVNPSFERLFGREAADVLGERLTQVFPGGEYALFDWLATYSEKALADQSTDFSRQIGKGDRWYQILAYSPEEGCVAVLIDDVTASIRRQQQLEYYADEVAATNSELKAFVNTIAHDFRSPMVNLKGFSGELGLTLAELSRIVHESESLLPEEVRAKMDELLDKEVPDAQQFINSAVDRLNRMVDALLNLSRMGRRDLSYKQVDLKKLVSTVLHSYQHQIGTKDIRVEVGELPKLRTDPLTTEQIIGNLVDNAIKYLDPGRPGTIAVSCSENDHEYVVRIKDNGRGIAAVDHEKIFEPFRRSGKHDQPGEGLGLAYVRTLVRQLGGRVWCESELGAGTTMSFTIPKRRG